MKEREGDEGGTVNFRFPPCSTLFPPPSPTLPDSRRTCPPRTLPLLHSSHDEPCPQPGRTLPPVTANPASSPGKALLPLTANPAPSHGEPCPQSRRTLSPVPATPAPQSRRGPAPSQGEEGRTKTMQVCEL